MNGGGSGRLAGSGAADGWPEVVWRAPVLRDLDPPSREAIARAGRLRRVESGASIYRAGDDSEAFYVVADGAVSLSAVRRGDEDASVLRVARRGDSFGAEATLPGVLRRVTAIAGDTDADAGASGLAGARIAEIPISVFRRVTGRAGAGRAAARERRMLERAATRDLLATLAFSRDLPEADVEMLLDAARFARHARGARVYTAGDSADSFHMIVEGLIQLQRDDDVGVFVSAYLSRGDFFGDEEILSREQRALSAVSIGDTWCLAVPAVVLRAVSDRNPGLLARIRRLAADRGAAQAEVVGAAAARSTQHVFKDLYRMQMARSLLVIDQDTCVRCGHCAWSCAEVHGVSRLVRRGDKVITRLSGASGAQVARSLLVPNSCQHCRNAACMIDCPTGAIGRDPEGEVYIREPLCTGCGACAKACPWENIQMAPRQSPAEHNTVAVKCDLCRGYQAPACVQACPTEALVRLEPAADIAEVQALFGDVDSGVSEPRTSIAGPVVSGVVAAAIALAALGWVAQASGRLVPGSGLGLAAGIGAGLALLALAAYAIPKRVVSLWMRRRVRVSAARRAAGTSASDGVRDTDSSMSRKGRARSRVMPWLVAHIALGVLAIAAVVAHAGPRAPASPAGALHLAFWITALLGVFGAVAYRALPPRLARLERAGALPEDLRGARTELTDSLYRQTSGRDELVKTIAERILIPYARKPLGWIALVASGRGLAAEERRLRAEIDDTLQGRGAERLAGLDDLIRTVVALRALPARRALTAALRAWLPAHILATAIALAMLLVHVITAGA